MRAITSWFLVCAGLLSSGPAFAEEKPNPMNAEIWEGKLQAAPGIALRLVLKITRADDGLHAKLDSPDQGAKDLPVEKIAIAEGKLTFTMPAIRGAYTGTLDASGSKATGEWTQGGAKLPLVMEKVEKASELKRPQEPKPPFPYKAEEVGYDTEGGKVHLAGTFTIPDPATHKGPYPAVLLISGSGPQDRDEALLGHRPFLVLADALTRRGIAVLRVDDRGVGGSTGDTMKSTTEDVAGDVLAGVKWLRARKEVAPKRVGLIGHSEGGLVAPMVAARTPDVAFIVLIAGPGLPGDEIVVRQGELIARAMGKTDDKELAKSTALQRALLDIAKTEKDAEAIKAKARPLLEKAIAEMTPEEKKASGGAAALDGRLAVLATPWFRFFLTYDPRPTLRKVKCPVLALNGEKDLQVPPKENLAEIARALAAGGNKHVETRELPGLNHLLQTARTGSPAEYATIEETMAPSALRLIGDWILAR